MEQLSIQNFGGIKSMTFEFKSINILIGPQGSGKSITAKLFYFFKSTFTDISTNILFENNIEEFKKLQTQKFIQYFPKDTWPKDSFKITYTLNDIIIIVENNDGGFLISYSNKIDIIYAKYYNAFKEQFDNDIIPRTIKWRQQIAAQVNRDIKRELSCNYLFNQYFIPAGRSFFSNLQHSMFSFIKSNSSIDPFLVEFGAVYEGIKETFRMDPSPGTPDSRFIEICTSILNGEYSRADDKDYLVHKDNRRVNLLNASSGQQETLPLLIFINALYHWPIESTTLYIEEPEAHLPPMAQKAIVQLLARTYNNFDNEFQIIITTHSPYILASFNNLLEAGRLTKDKPGQAASIAAIVPTDEQLDPALVAAYSLQNGEMESLIDPDSQLIKQTILDDVSNEIANEFGKLLDIEFNDEKL
ncbi:ATP-binding protein [Chitinophaga skermanii]|nr:ATP-binding protein [Chitinophaga skermanii]